MALHQEVRGSVFPRFPSPSALLSLLLRPGVNPCDCGVPPARGRVEVEQPFFLGTMIFFPPFPEDAETPTFFEHYYLMKPAEEQLVCELSSASDVSPPAGLPFPPVRKPCYYSVPRRWLSGCWETTPPAPAIWRHLHSL